MPKRKSYSGVLIVTMIFLTAILILSGCGEETPPQTATPAPTMPGPAEPWSADGIIKVREYAGDMRYGDYQVFWRSDDQYAYIGIRAKTDGFVAMGIQPGSRMKDADIIFGFIKDGIVNVFDLYSTGDFGPHSGDTELGGNDDIVEFGGSEEDGFTTIEFKRALNTGDKYDLPFSKGVNKIIWSYGSADELKVKHSARGYGEINL